MFIHGRIHPTICRFECLEQQMAKDEGSGRGAAVCFLLCSSLRRAPERRGCRQLNVANGPPRDRVGTNEAKQQRQNFLAASQTVDPPSCNKKHEHMGRKCHERRSYNPHTHTAQHGVIRTLVGTNIYNPHGTKHVKKSQKKQNARLAPRGCRRGRRCSTFQSQCRYRQTPGIASGASCSPRSSRPRRCLRALRRRRRC